MIALLFACLLACASGNVVVTIKQSEPTCPRTCPGRVGTSELCRRLRNADLFYCDLSWNNGFSGAGPADTRMREFSAATLKAMCGGCGHTMELALSEDVEVELAK